MDKEKKEEIKEMEEQVSQIAEKEDLNEKISKLEDELEDYKKAYTLKLAEFQNFSKRKEKELQEYKEYAAKGIILKFTEALDNLERAIVATKESKNYDILIEGLEMSINTLNENLKSEQVEKIDPIGLKYDILEHQAINTINNPEVENDVITLVFQKGYKLKGKVIRPAIVQVNKIEENIKEEN